MLRQVKIARDKFSPEIGLQKQHSNYILPHLTTTFFAVPSLMRIMFSPRCSL